MPNIALLGPSGVSLRSVEAQLRLDPAIAVFDVEDRLVSDDGLWKHPRLQQVPREKRLMRSLVESLPRERILQYWSEAYTSLAEQVSDEPNQSVVIGFHPSLFSARRSEFYSTLGEPIRSTATLQFDHVILLIDDIYDIQRRLGGRNDIFHAERLLKQHLSSQKITSLLSPLDEVAVEHRNAWHQVRMENSNAIMAQILAWRRFDMIQAELLARAHACGVTVLGVKHPFSTLVNLAKGAPTITTAYLSHPISRPRRALRKGLVNDWPRVVPSSNMLGDRLAQREIELIMPTAIDEFRLPSNTTPSPMERAYTLDKRWPLLAPYGPIAQDGLQISDLPQAYSLEGTYRYSSGDDKRPREVSVDLSVQGPYARTLEKLIIAEVPFRDHFLVSHTNAFLVYRPMYGVSSPIDASERGGRFSGGVQAEIDHWADSWAGKASRRALFVHSFSDLKEMVWLWAGPSASDATERRDHQSGMREAAIAQLTDRYGLRTVEAARLLNGEQLPSDMLDTARLDTVHDDLEALLDQVFRDAAEAYLLQYLTGGIENADILTSSDLAVLIIEEEELNDRLLDWCAGFLRGDVVPNGPLVDPSGLLPKALGCTDLAEWAHGLLRQQALA